MLSPESHRLPTRKPNPVIKPIRILGNTPECAIFHLRDPEVEGLASVLWILDDGPNDAARGKVESHLAGNDLAGPVGGFVHGDGDESARHCDHWVATGYGKADGRTEIEFQAVGLIILCSSSTCMNGNR